MKIEEKAIEILSKYPLCDHCLGRQFGLLGKNLTNRERGFSIKTQIVLNESENYQENKSDQSLNILKIVAEKGMFPPAIDVLKSYGIKSVEISQACYLCENIFQKLEKFADLAIEEIQDIEFESFLVGSLMPNWMIEKEDAFRSEFSITHGEALRAELNREVGKLIFFKLKDKSVVFDHPNLVILIDPIKEKVELNIHPIFIRGFYKKLVRGIPQTKWTCNNCWGKGCEECNFEGKRYPTSVSELIGYEILQISKGKDLKFHGSGREDIDALMLGDGRDFIIEIKEPLKRSHDLNELKNKINEYGQGKIEVSSLRYSNKDEVRKIKAVAPFTQKTYKALVETEGIVDQGILSELESNLSNITLKQQTPQRVLHRRADKIRTKNIYEIKTRKIKENQFELIVTADGGTYIKEFISGDEGRTIPSVSSILNFNAICKELDVINITKS